MNSVLQITDQRFSRSRRSRRTPILPDWASSVTTVSYFVTLQVSPPDMFLHSITAPALMIRKPVFFFAWSASGSGLNITAGKASVPCKLRKNAIGR